ncbi:diaminopimelate decarboxylase [Yinghuangia soli]|uniref:Diaminopimelate decarboxylase n=1 Tax=Yinghuangia soli TaxID=2908204 RepID=A0AA41TZV6_9ACTN|nr:diaminopimelate decarboxylase [Yinghuangia soli]MCF2527715.1 diaminopimelate decarboxylase [Yinghuangia soli]
MTDLTTTLPAVPVPALVPGSSVRPRPTGPRGPADAVWSARARPDAADGEVTVAGLRLSDLAERFGTPLYVLDEGEFRDRCRAYRRALPQAHVAYAGKAFLSRAVAAWVREEGLHLDVCSLGELEVAAAAGFPAERMILHGNAKTPDELRAALRFGVGRIVLDNVAEVARLAALVPAHDRQAVLIRVIPGVEAGAHKAIRTGTADQKFGLSIEHGAAEDAIARVLDQPRLELVGLHCHLGSQITSVRPFLAALPRMAALAARVRDRHGVVLPELDLGGGHGIAYRSGEHALDPAEFADDVMRHLVRAYAAVGLPGPQLIVEPGRALIGPAGVAVYRVLVVKRTGDRTFVAVDGGMNDNPRPALYGARPELRLIGRAGARTTRTVTVVGRFCEAGDILAPDVELPDDVRPGDLLAAPAAGAYQMAMASTYNMVGRPPVVAVRDGRARVIVRRETTADLLARDVPLGD